MGYNDKHQEEHEVFKQFDILENRGDGYGMNYIQKKHIFHTFSVQKQNVDRYSHSH